MFTGIVKDLGRVESLSRGSITVSTCLEGILPGESVMVDGVCLTVSGVTPGRLRMDIGTETARMTSLKFLRAGSEVNLEDALTLSSKIGGHIVYGHVMALGNVISARKSGKTLHIRIRCDRGFAAKLVPKGSVAVNGVSLTVNRKNRDFFEVGLIPETASRTNLGSVRVSGRVNLEADLLVSPGV